ncbi:MAG: LacI family DNA-binding transcriptional regulator [Balneolaceae bacterium]
MKTTLKDIAEDTGLSISTVSRALSATGKTTEENERIIYESAHRLNYPLVHQQTPTHLRSNIYIALVTCFHPGEFYASFYNGFDHAAKGSNINFGLYNVDHKNLNPIEFVLELRKDKFDAAVCFLPSLTEADYCELLDKAGDNFPILSAAPIANPIMDTVTFDNYRGGYLVANHFHQRNYKKVGIIEGPTEKLEARLRKTGFQDFVNEKQGMELVWSTGNNYSPEAGQEAFDEFLALKNRPEAIFASNDALALGFMHRARHHGIRIPDDVAVAGYDDLPFCRYNNPTLTSVHTPFRQLGITILNNIKQRLDCDHSNQHSGMMNLIPVSLNVRESS